MVTLTLHNVCIKGKGGTYTCRSIPHNMSNQRMHWTVKKKWTDAWKEEVCGQFARSHRDKKYPLAYAHITITLRTCRLMDYDGAYNAVKPLLDALKPDCAGAIIDDSPKYIDLQVKQEKVAHLKEQGVEIEIS